MPYFSPKTRTGCATKGNRITPNGGKLTPPIKRNMLEARARTNLLMTSNRSMGMDRWKCLVFGSGKGEQRHAASSFYSGGQQPLVARAVSGDSTGRHFPPFRNKLSDRPQIFIIDC